MTTRTELTEKIAALRESISVHERAIAATRFEPKKRGEREAIKRIGWLIEDVEAELAVLPAEPEPVAAPADTRRRNVYAGTCECGRHVPAGAGFLEYDGRWLVFCGSCGLSSTVG